MSNQDEKNAMLQGEIDNLNQKVAFLEQKLKELQENRSIPRQPWDVIEPGPYLTMEQCRKCGMNLKNSMGYCCADPKCPTFFKVTC